MGADGTRYPQSPGQIDRLWTFDVGADLSVVVIDAAYYAGTPQGVLDEMQTIATSPTFG